MASVWNVTRPRKKQARGAAHAGTGALALWAMALRPMLAAFPASAPAGRVVEIEDFGANPGGLRMMVYAPSRRLAPGAPLIVVLHGCGQRAAAFARDCGWIAQAERIGAALVLPEQTADNSQGRCFNWFQPGDTRRGSGEAASIRRMVRVALARFQSDPRRVFIVGLSAGGAMAAAMLAAYPTTFAAGAVVAGMPVGAAFNGVTALMRMRRAESFSNRRLLADAVRRAAPSTTRPRAWPRLSIWQGEADKVVDPRNAEVLAAQWSALHGFDGAPTIESWVRPGVRRRIWRGTKSVAVELLTIDRMSHGFPVDAGAAGGGRAGYGVVNAGLPAARMISEFWGLGT